jgi:soluble lytic murein transglycosylase
MSKKITFIAKILTIVLILCPALNADEILIVPIKKPILGDAEKTSMLSKNIIKPQKKPKKEKTVDTVKFSDKLIKPKEKPTQKDTKKKLVIKDTTDKITKKEDDKIVFLIPKSKPLIFKKEKIKIQKKSKYFKQKDFDLARKAIQSFEKKQWPKALNYAKKARDKSIYNFIQWKYLLTTPNQAGFYDYKSFIENNKNYPRINRIKYIAEHKLDTKKIDAKKIINWFSTNDPLSGYGKLILGESLISTGEIPNGIKYIKEGWITADLSRPVMKTLSKRYKKYLTAEDNIKRADHLAWENKYWDLKRMLRYLPKDYELLYTARQILMSKSYGVDQAIKNVPSKLKNDAGLNYDRLKWRRKRGRVDSSLEILLKIKNTKDYLVRPDKWWKERAIIARSLIYKKKYELAYKITSKHSLDNGPELAEAEWMSGWIALSFLKDPILAKDHFTKFYNNVGYPISLSRGAYWLGKSHEEIGDKTKSNYWYEEASKYLTTYYGQLAHLKIKPNQNFELPEKMEIEEKYRNYFYKKELVTIVYLLDELNKDKYTKHILKHLANDNILKGSEVLAAELATNISRYDFAIQISKLASYEKRFHNDFNYPIISTPKYINGRKIPETAFILSIIRQESEFDMTANSHAGAQGLMQLMPYTAKLVSRQAKLPYSKSRLTTDPEYNINLGSHYIAGLILEYDGAYPFAVAAYNAGPKRVKYWKKINKNPQKNQVDYVDWVELIKFKETRNYVQRVLENYNVYRYILEKKPIPVINFFKDKPLF